MFFNTLDIIAATRFVLRKGTEVATITMNQEISESDRFKLVDNIMWRIAKARILSSIGLNNMYVLIEEMDQFIEPGPELSPQLENWYCGISSEDERADDLIVEEMEFTLLGNMDIINIGLEISESKDPCCSIDGNDLILLRRISDSLGDGEVEQKLSVICSVLMRIGSMGMVDNIRISEAVDSLRTIDLNDVPDSMEMVTFRSKKDRYLGSMIARSIMNCIMPEMTRLNASPLGPRSSI